MRLGVPNSQQLFGPPSRQPAPLPTHGKETGQRTQEEKPTRHKKPLGSGTAPLAYGHARQKEEIKHSVMTYNLHLESKGDDRLRESQLLETVEDAKQFSVDTPILLAGDFNLDASEGTAASVIRQSQFHDAFSSQHVPTTPSSFFKAGRRIDWIFSRGRVRATQPQVYRSVSASDHYPLSISLNFI